MSINLTRYRNLVIRDFAGEPTESELEAIEQELGASLPPDFIEFLKVGNGGCTDYSARVPPPDGEFIGLSRIYSTMLHQETLSPNILGRLARLFQTDPKEKQPMGTFLGEIRLSRQTRAMPREVLPFADDGGECDFYLDLTAEGQGRVVVFRGGLPAWTGRPSEDAFFPVADSFVTFIDSLSVEPDLAENMLTDAIAEQDAEELAAVKEILDSGLPGWRETLGTDV